MFTHRDVEIKVLETTSYEIKNRDGSIAYAYSCTDKMFYVAEYKNGIYIAMSGPEALAGAKKAIDDSK